ncbi:MAG: alginate lyase family protein [Vicinamibacterales bacterium]
MFRRLARMDGRQAAFRVRGEVRKVLERTRAAIGAPRWDRKALAFEMRHLPQEPDWTRARSAIRRGDFREAQAALGRYFAGRRSAFPLDAVDVQHRAHFVTQAFPNAVRDATRRAEALTEGEYDLLGYRDLHLGSSVDWHTDPVHGRRAPTAHWSAVRYLNPAYGDHKVIWELNRHQHWLSLGRAYALTGRRKYYDLFRNQLAGWMRSNPPTLGINWASMLELGFRTISWLWAIGFFSAAALEDDASGEPWLVDALLGITRQLQHIERNLSLYFSPNTHLTGEALALYAVGCALPGLESSARWTQVGRDVLLREAQAQVLGDGGHAELSGHYHRYSTDFYLLALTIARAAGDPFAPALEQAARMQARYLRTITDNEGRRPATGDDDGGQLFPMCGRGAEDCADTLAVAAVLLREPDLAVDSAPEEAFWWCGDEASHVAGGRRIERWHSRSLNESGYCVSRNPRGDYLLFDAGRHGFLNCGHAHSDALSIVLTIAGRPLFVDPGTATYTMDPELRDRFRSTAMHNTLLLDGKPQSEPDGPFHWRTRATAYVRVWRSTATTRPDGADYIEGTHDGYAPRRHVRSVLAVHGIGWWILDHVFGAGSAEALTHWHLHPAWHPSIRDGHVVLKHSDGIVLGLATTGDVAVARPGDTPLAFWSPEYGRVEPAPTIAIQSRGVLPLALATFIPAQPAFTRGLRLQRLMVRDAPLGWLGTGWRANWEGGEISLLASVITEDTGGDSSSWSPTLWGTEALTTDGRVASVVRVPGHECLVLIDGSRVIAPGAPLTSAQLPVDIVRREWTDMAPLVHEHEPAEARVN